MKNILETIKLKNGYVNIVTDSFCDSPLEYDNNIGTIYGSTKYTNVHPISEFTKGIHKTHIYLNIWKYEHGGISLSTGETNPFSCPWDSCFFGVIAVSKEHLRKTYNWKNVSSHRAETVKRWLEMEVADYSAWLNGECYGYEAYDNNDELIDSCYGYIGELGYKDAIADGKSNIGE